MNDKILEGVVRLLIYKKGIKDQRLNLVALKKLLSGTSYNYNEFHSFLLTKGLITSARNSLNSINTKEKILEVITPYFGKIEETILPEVKEIIDETPLSFFDEESKKKEIELESTVKTVSLTSSTDSILDGLSSDHITLENGILGEFGGEVNSTETIKDNLSNVKSEEEKVDTTVEIINTIEKNIVEENKILGENLTEDIVEFTDQKIREIDDSKIVNESESKGTTIIEEDKQVDEVIVVRQEETTKEDDVSNLVDEVLAERKVKEEFIVESKNQDNSIEIHHDEVIEEELNNIDSDELEEKFKGTKNTFNTSQTDFINDKNDFLNDLSDTVTVSTLNNESKFKFTPLDFILGGTLGVVGFVISYFFL